MKIIGPRTGLQSMHKALIAGFGSGSAIALLLYGGEIIHLPLLMLGFAALYFRLIKGIGHTYCDCK